MGWGLVITGWENFRIPNRIGSQGSPVFDRSRLLRFELLIGYCWRFLFLNQTFSFFHNCGTSLYLKGNYYWRYTNFFHWTMMGGRWRKSGTSSKTNMVHLKMGAPWKFGDSYWFHHHFQVPAVNFLGCMFFSRPICGNFPRWKTAQAPCHPLHHWPRSQHHDPPHSDPAHDWT